MRHRPTARRTAGVAVVALSLALVGCGAEDEPTEAPTFGGGTPAAGEPEVGTTALRSQRQEAGIADCADLAPPADPSTAAPSGIGGVTLPVASLPCLGGTAPVSLASLRGTPTVVNLWASWCGPCRDELPVLADLDERTGDRLRVVGVDYQDPDPSAALALAADAGVRYPSVADPEGVLRDPLKVVALPQTVLVDADGRVVAVERRAFDSLDDLAAVVEDELGVAS